MRELKTDICIIGAGSGGLSLAAGAAQLGKSVVLIEKGEMGGDCLNYGCVPSKALLSAAAAAQAVRDATKYGVAAGEPVVDYAAAMDHVRRTIETIAPHDSQERFEGFGVAVIRAHARFVGPRTVEAGDARVTAKFVVIATGSSPFVPPIPGLEATPHFTNETLFANRVKPDHLIVLGGGPIGVEMAQAHRRLGSKVTIVEGLTILNRDDPEAVAVVRDRLLAEGVALVENARAALARKTERGVALALEDGRVIEGSHLLVAVGRKANVDGLDLEKAGVAYDRKGVTVDEGLRSSNRRVFAMGDVAGSLQFTHVAGDHASTLVKRLLFKTPAKRRDHLAPRVTYCDPELASVGLSETEARERHGDTVSVARWTFGQNDRAIAEAATAGFVKVVAGAKGRILGATIVGKGAGDAILLWAYALANGQSLRSVTNVIAPYPTRSEASKRAASAYFTPTLFSDRVRTLIRLLSIFD